MPLVGTKANAGAFGLGWSASSAEELGGMVLIRPTSIASTGAGSSSNIGTNGSVTFTACATLSLNGVFTTSYDNYMIVIRYIATGSQVMNYRLRVSGTDASGNNYTNQYLLVNYLSVTASRESSAQHFRIANHESTLRQGDTIYLYGPALAQPTAQRSVSASSLSSACIFDEAGTHSLSTAYDGFTLLPTGQTITGLVSVYGLGG